MEDRSDYESEEDEKLIRKSKEYLVRTNLLDKNVLKKDEQADEQASIKMGGGVKALDGQNEEVKVADESRKLKEDKKFEKINIKNLLKDKINDKKKKSRLPKRNKVKKDKKNKDTSDDSDEYVEAN